MQIEEEKDRNMQFNYEGQAVEAVPSFLLKTY
jgi:hypothetical protein